MEYPALRAYMAAIADLKNINIPFFKSKSMQIYLNRRGVPYMSVGGFGAVFRFKDKNGKQYALKCFTRNVPGRAERYQALHDTLQVTRFPFMVDFQYVQEGIRVGKNYFPVVVMEWGRGTPMDLAIEDDFEDNGELNSGPNIAGNLFSIVKTLQEWKMGHGDLQEGNLLIGDDGQITLIDYDGMFVPALEGKNANEVGLADYQHPDRKNAHFSENIDDFSLISILYQLSILTPELWGKHHVDRRVIMSKKDYEDGGKATLIKKGLSSGKPHIKELATMLCASYNKDPLALNAIEEIQKSPAIMAWLKATESVAVDSNFTSIITRVVSLTDEQVTTFEEKEEPALIQQEQSTEHVTHISEGDQDDVNIDGAWGVGSSIKSGLVNMFFEEAESTGNEGSLMDLFFESSNEDPNAPPPSSGRAGRALGKLKKGFMNLMFEEGTDGGESDDDDASAGGNAASYKPSWEQDPAGSPPAAPSTPAATPAPPPPAPEEEPAAAAPPAPTPKEEPPAPPAPTASDPAAPADGKTAPKPDWMKRRKRK